MTRELLPLGAWEADRTELEKSGAAGIGDVADLSDEIQFRTYVARIITRRERNENAEFDLPATFILVCAKEFEELAIGRSVERLIHSGARRLTGRIHFVQANAISSVVEEFVGDDSAMFSRIKALGFDGHRTLVYVPQKPRSSLSFYAKGTRVDDFVYDIPLGVDPVNAEEIEAVIRAVHEQELVTPDTMKPDSAWAEASSGKPDRDAERRIQQMVRHGLIGRYSNFSIRSEQSGPAGRTDLEIVDDQTGPRGTATHHAVLELKVLRSRGETGIKVTPEQTEEHVVEGVSQAFAYGKNKNTRVQMLCCFDMRDDDVGDSATFAHVLQRGAELSVLLRRWFLYRSSADYRAALTAASTH